MNSVAPSRRPSACSAAGQPGRQSARARAAPAEALHRRPRPVGGQLQQRRRARELLAASSRAARSSTSPCSQLALPDREVRVLDRQLGQRRRPARARRPRRAPPARAPARPCDQPSQTMWCMVSSSTCSSRPAAAARPRSSGPRARSNGRPRLLRGQAQRLRLARRSPAGPTGRRPAARSGAGGCDHLHRRARPAPRRWCAAPRGGARSRRGARSSAADVQRARQPQRRRACCRAALPGSSWSRNQSRCWANESGRAPSRGTGHERRRPTRAPLRR